ncbi:hypothetical protein F485_gp397 [Aeromonas phage CC2]|uniref:Uncharacterized protein n=1 Tax=Aeromonas phage CC2 TaxID=1204516 RepID=I6WBX9_9CAUD|nr:hypothetical protein F485_gp397 [Aeromonas phage CC2]AFN39450.1 hypothetical protein CC2_397 [Aeromonas phage CC2]
MKKKIINDINSAIGIFENESLFKGTNDCISVAMFSLNGGPYFEHHTFSFQALVRASEVFNKYQIATENEFFNVQDVDVRQAYFDVIVSELKLAKTFVEKYLIE